MFGGRRGSLVEQVTVAVPGLPAAVEGLRIAHISDLHVSRWEKAAWNWKALGQGIEADVVFLTGDYMNHEGDEEATVQRLSELMEKVRSRLGCFGVFGNHDTVKLRRMLAGLGVRWLVDEVVVLAEVGLEIWGLGSDRVRWPDLPRLLEGAPLEWQGGVFEGGLARGRADRLRVMLAHHPFYLPVAAELGMHLVFSGHTHGGQIRLPGAWALYNSTDLPLHLTAGILRCRSTLGLVCRGLGWTFLPVRVFCRPHIPIYRLISAAVGAEDDWTVRSVRRW